MRTLLCVLAITWASVANASFEAAVQATCRITNPAGQMGTGVVTTVTGDYVGVLTNAHVVGNHQTVRCEFYRRGYQSQPVEAAVAARASTDAVDAALLAIRASVFGDMAPKPVKLASVSYVVKPGETIMSVGCAKGTWPTAWIGHAKGYVGSHLLFNPPPANGRSGSALFNEAGDIVGLIFARSNDDSVGLACSIQAMHTELAADCKRQGDRFTYTGQTSLVSWTPVQQCGPGGCPGGQCTPDLFKGRKQKQGQQQTPPQSSPWPGFGGGAPTPATPPVDLSPLAAQLEKIAKNTEPKADADPPVPEKSTGVKPNPNARPIPDDVPPPDMVPAIQQAIGQNAADIKALSDSVPGLVQKSIAPVAEKVDTIAGAVKPLIALKAKLDAAEEAGGIKGRIAQRVEDRVFGAEDDDPVVRSKTVKVLAWAAIVVACGFVILRIHNGTSALCGLRDKVKERLSERSPELAAKLNEVEAKIHNRIDAIQGKAKAVAPVVEKVAEAAQTPAESTTT